jgi:hypothetical protein
VTRALRQLEGRFAVARLEQGTGFPWWATYASFACVTRTESETSVVCDEQLVPPGTKAQRGFTAFAVEGILDFSEIGVLAGLTGALADAGVSCFVVSTHDTDYVLVRADRSEVAAKAWRTAGWSVTEASR